MLIIQKDIIEPDDDLWNIDSSPSNLEISCGNKQNKSNKSKQNERSIYAIISH